MNFRQAGPIGVARWLSSGVGELVLYSLNTVIDAWIERARQGVMARFPSSAPSDALELISKDRKITRGLNELDASLAARLPSWLDTHRTAGNSYSLLEQVRIYLQSNVKVRTFDQIGNYFTIDADGTRSYESAIPPNWDGTTVDNWARFWVVIYPGTYWTSRAWGDGSKWGDGVWGLSATSDEISGLRTIVRQWTPSHAHCEQIIIAFDENSFASGTDLGGGYSRWANRLITARYLTP